MKQRKCQVEKMETNQQKTIRSSPVLDTIEYSENIVQIIELDRYGLHSKANSIIICVNVVMTQSTQL